MIHHHQSPNAICDKVLEVDGDGKRCCKLLLFALHLCCLFVVAYVWQFDVCDFFVIMTFNSWCFFGHFSLLRKINHCKVGFGRHELWNVEGKLYEEAKL
jgi:hypothetical protein